MTQANPTDASGIVVWPRAIPVEERLPKVGLPVLVYWCGDWDVAVRELGGWSFEFPADVEEVYDSDGRYVRFFQPDTNDDAPQYWMPLPPPP